MDCLVEENIADTPAQVAVDNDHTVKLSMCTKCTTWCIYNKATANKICSWCLPQLQVLSLQFSLVGSRSIHHQNKLQRVKTLWMQNTHTLCTYMYLYCHCQNCLCGPLLGVMQQEATRLQLVTMLVAETLASSPQLHVPLAAWSIYGIH